MLTSKLYFYLVIMHGFHVSLLYSYLGNLWKSYNLFFFNIIIYFWLMIGLQYWFDFCHTSTWITIGIHMSPPPPSLNLPFPSRPFPPLSDYRAPVWVPWVIRQIPIGCLFTHISEDASVLLSPFISSAPSSPLPLSIRLFPVS